MIDDRNCQRLIETHDCSQVDFDARVQTVLEDIRGQARNCPVDLGWFLLPDNHELVSQIHELCLQCVASWALVGFVAACCQLPVIKVQGELAALQAKAASAEQSRSLKGKKDSGNARNKWQETMVSECAKRSVLGKSALAPNFWDTPESLAYPWHGILGARQQAILNVVESLDLVKDALAKGLEVVADLSQSQTRTTVAVGLTESRLQCSWLCVVSCSICFCKSAACLQPLQCHDL